jgi:hypothetical protein
MLKIAFILDSAAMSGGANVIFRHAMELVKRGMTVAFVSRILITPRDVDWHPIAKMVGDPHLLWLDYHAVSQHRFDVAFATWWRTFFDLWKIRAERYAYFVQSIESRFYLPHEHVIRTAVDATYEAPVGFVTEARWIRDYLKRMHGHTAELAVNGIDKSIYRPEGKVLAPHRRGCLRVLLEGPLDVGFKNVPASIRLAHEGGADEVWLLTSSSVERVVGVDQVFSRIPQTQTAAVYRSCDVLLKLSTVEGLFGPPLEMFHCGGTSIVYSVTGYDEYIVHGRNGLVARPHDEASIRSYIRRLKETPELLQNLKDGALATSNSWPDWRESGRQFEAALSALICRPTVERSELGTYSRRIWKMVENHRIELDYRLANANGFLARLGARSNAAGELDITLGRLLYAAMRTSEMRLRRGIRGFLKGPVAKR